MADVRAEADRVLQITAELGDMRKRLAELDAERAELEQRIKERLLQLGRSEKEGEPRSIADHVLAHLRRNAGTVYSALAIANEWQFTRTSDINNVRAALHRLHARRKIDKVSFGHYVVRNAP
jgi:uncharacterized protein involved in exopolysaccharide biosynthesis